ncbi:hypothetical protein D8B20_04980 [Candidatus Pantoea soli]|uniref:Uncharacterized protein n=1 Tax=Candidatus Pantoea soli TaxID=3098669 RepID=A0A518XAS1_9GAMM|nr:hypothetical protein D8B20_04980 [Pantoea soli]
MRGVSPAAGYFRHLQPEKPQMFQNVNSCYRYHVKGNIAAKSSAAAGEFLFCEGDQLFAGGLSVRFGFWLHSVF